MHRLTRRSLAINLLALLGLVSACDKSPVRPPAFRILMSVRANPTTGNPSNPVMIEIRIVNAGSRAVWVCAGCGCEGGLLILGPDGRPVALDDPKEPLPLCPVWNEPFKPGAVFQGARPFRGVLYAQDSPTWPSPTYAAPPGRYTVIVRFRYTLTPGGGGQTVEETTVFDWQP